MLWIVGAFIFALLVYAWFQNRDRDMWAKLKRRFKGGAQATSKNDGDKTQPATPTPSTAAPEINAGTEMVELTDDDFSKHIMNGEWVVMYYAPWCGHCQTLMPVYAQCGKAALEARKNGRTNTQIGQVDVTRQSKVAEQEGVNGTPTIVRYKNGDRQATYQGDRTFADMLQFAINNNNQ